MTPLRVTVDGTAQVDGESVRDAERVVAGPVDVVSDGPVGVEIESIGRVEAAVHRALTAIHGGQA